MAAPAPYCTQADVEAVIGRAALVSAAGDPDADTVDAAKVERAIAAAGSRIDAALRARYTLPLPDVPEILRRTAVRLVHAELVDECSATDLIAQRAEASGKLLDRIAAGRLRIGGDLDGDAGLNASTGAARAHVARRRTTFGRDGLKGVV